MLRHGCLIITLFIAILVMIPVVASNYVPGWGVLLIVLGELAALRYGIPWLITVGVGRVTKSLIETKSSVLRGAGVHVHRVERTTAPADANQIEHRQEIESGTGEATLVGAIPGDDRYVLVEFTLTPRMGESKMNFYDPSELILVPIEKEVTLANVMEEDSDNAALMSIAQVDDSGNERRHFDKSSGPSRLKAVFSIPPTMTGRVKFQYYFEAFGDFLLPGDLG